MFKVNVYKYDSTQEENGYKGEDFSQHILQGSEFLEDITQELDTAEITLSGLPFSKEFDPETKLIIELVDDSLDEENVNRVKTYHFCVDDDVVNQPILSDNNYFDHHISLIEPSVVAQKRLVDNISATYKLKDVTLTETTPYPNKPITLNFADSQFVPSSNFKASYDIGFLKDSYEISNGKYFVQEGDISIANKKGEAVSSVYNDIEKFKNDDGTYTAIITLPKIAIMYGVYGGNTFSKIGYASIDYKIIEYKLTDEYNPTKIISNSIISNSNLGQPTVLNSYPKWLDKLDGEWLYEKATQNITNSAYSQGYPTYYYRKYTEKNAGEPNYTLELPISVDKRYEISVSLHQFTDNLPNYSEVGSYNYAQYEKLTDEYPYYYSRVKAEYTSGSETKQTFKAFTNVSLSPNQTKSSTKIVTYSADTGTIIYSHAIPYSALALLQKAIINSSLYEKKDGVYVADVNKSDTPFYIDDSFLSELSASTIIETFYNQKNLWEIMIDVGHYIHAVPELKFGKDDKFLITFNKLGDTNQKEDISTNVSIFNSRSVEDYICATSSYITNMVQLGGEIEEFVVSKTSDETLTVSNDTAEIIVTKPIIELLSVVAYRKSDNLEADLTKYIYEENVYKTLSIDYNVVPNRGIAMYYSLGTNKIVGGQYQLPQENTNVYSDYAFKKIIYSAYNGYPISEDYLSKSEGLWTNINIQDYYFKVSYRTKDSVRQNHVRPDIRKYLLNSKYDKYPQHNQFNNQTDVVVDSIKFGNNVYGDLIKTGNSSYEKLEYNTNFASLKQKGQLYKIRGELYYVSKIAHTVQSTFILSKVTYSKDYNELSKIIGIPSEPRFYEISEQSLIRREFPINDFMLLTDNNQQIEYGSNFIFDFTHIKDLILGEGAEFAKYALTVYKGDKDAFSYDQTVGVDDFYKEVLTPVNAYSSENTLTYEWDMVDNYSAGDKVITPKINTEIELNKRAYGALRAVSYTDIYGRASLVDFFIIKDLKNKLTPEQIKALPESPITEKSAGGTTNFVGKEEIFATNMLKRDENYNGRGLALLKDCREAISINYNLQLITNSDTFVISPFFFLPDKKNVRIVLLSQEVNKLSNGYINNSEIITPLDYNGEKLTVSPKVFNQYDLSENGLYPSSFVESGFRILPNICFDGISDRHFGENASFPKVRAYAVVCEVSLNPSGEDSEATPIETKTKFIFARNIPSDWGKDKALKPIFFGSPKKEELFKNKQ